MKEGGEMLPVVRAVGRMRRVAVEIRPVPKLPPRTFSETGKTVSGAFLEFFNQYGLDICGYPITDQFTEAGLPTQYFQRLALEEGKPGKVRLKLIGSEVWRSRRTIAQLRAYIQELRSLPVTGLAQPDIQDITAELPTHPNKHYPARKLTDINQIVIHHTGTSPTIPASATILSSPPMAPSTRPTAWRRYPTTPSVATRTALASASPATLARSSPPQPRSNRAANCVPGCLAACAFPRGASLGWASSSTPNPQVASGSRASVGRTS